MLPPRALPTAHFDRNKIHVISGTGHYKDRSQRISPPEAVRATEEELSRLNRILQTLYQCNHALVHATDENELFQSFYPVQHRLLDKCAFVIVFIV